MVEGMQFDRRLKVTLDAERMAGEIASLLLSRMTVPILYYLSERKKYEQPGSSDYRTETPGTSSDAPDPATQAAQLGSRIFPDSCPFQSSRWK